MKVNPPRALFTGYPNASIVGPPADAQAQTATLRCAFEVARDATNPGEIVDLRDETTHQTNASG